MAKDYMKDWAAKAVEEIGTASEREELKTPGQKRQAFFERLEALVLKPVSYRDKGGHIMRACILMPKTLKIHTVGVSAYSGYFRKPETFCIPRISIDLYDYTLPEKYVWAWREVYGACPVDKEVSSWCRHSGLHVHGCKHIELTCTIDELPELAITVFKLLDNYDRNGDGKEIQMPFGIGMSSNYMWTDAASVQQNEYNATKRPLRKITL